MRAQVLETIWRRPEGIWVRPSLLAECLGVDTAHVNELARRGLLTRRASDGAVFVEGLDTPRFQAPAPASGEAATIANVAEMLQAVRRDLHAVHARIDEDVENEVSRVFAETLHAAPSPAPAAPRAESRWFAFPFGISL